MRLKDVTEFCPAYDGPIRNDTVAFVPMEALRYDSIAQREIPFAEARGKYTYFADGDVLFAKVTPCLENGNIAVAKGLKGGIGFGSSEIFVLRTKPGLNNRWLFYVVQASPFLDGGCATMCGVGGLKRMSPLFPRTFELEIPSEKRQRRIVAYLDEKVGAIDGRVAVLERKLAAYRRLKASVINRAVTHGSGTRKMKATGIPWLPQVPEEWEVKRMKDIVSSMRSGGTPKATVEDFYSDDGVNWVTIADMSSADYVKATEKHLTEKGVADKNLELHPVGTVLYSMYATLGKVSELAVAATINQAMLAIQFRKGVDKAFMKYALKAFEPWAVAEATESTQKNLNAEKVRRFPMPFPPLAEQRAIVSYLDGACERIGRAAELVEREIALYRRLKRALVNEVVTGKREVP